MSCSAKTFKQAAAMAIASVLGCLVPILPAWAQHAHHAGGGKATQCNEATLKCATKVTPAIGPDGAVWVAFQAAGRVLVARSADDGRTFSPPVAVTAEPRDLDWGPDARPKIVVDNAGRVHVAFAVFKDKHFNGQVFHARSSDGGATFSVPSAITDVQESQRFEMMGVSPDGRVFAVWLDKRNRVAAKARGEKYLGAALAYAWGDADGAPTATTLVAGNTCECCRMAIGFAGAGRPVVLFRNIFDGGVRDHGVVTFADAATPGPVKRVAVDGWKTDACPHHGPALSIGPDGAYHVAWYTNGAARQGVFYARTTDGGETFSAPMPIGSQARQASRPALLALNGKVHLIWKEFDGQVTSVLAMTSTNGGADWRAPHAIATTTADSDHPLLIARGDQGFLSWQTQDHGYRLVPLGSGT